MNDARGAKGLKVRSRIAAGALTGVMMSVVVALPDRVSAATPQRNHLDVYVGDQVIYDDNVFRKSSPDLLAPNLVADDYINSISVGLRGSWALGRQAFETRMRVADNRFKHNDSFDNRSGSGRLVWDWVFGDRISGQLGGDYNRALANFANTGLFDKDIVDTAAYFGSLQFDVNPHWKLKSGVNRSQSSHSFTGRQGDNYQSNSGTAGIEFRTASLNTIGWGYRYTKTDFNRDILVSGLIVNRNYEENTANFSLKYALGAKTTLDGNFGYLKRDYPNSQQGEFSISNFSGDVWQMALRWRSTDKTSIRLSAWRQLRAYLNTESDYFVSKGGSIQPIWQPTDKLQLSLEYSQENQDYIGSGLTFSTVPEFSQRNDKLKYVQVAVTYEFFGRFEVDLSYRYEKRDSDRVIYDYDDKLASIGVKLVF